MILLVAALVLAQEPQRFDHEQHARVFPSCLSCHAGAARPSAPLWPTPDGCAQCHDGTVQPRVRWAPPAGLRASNLRFDHQRHADVLAQRRAGVESPGCGACHTETGAPRMAVRPAVVSRCLDCHGIRVAHLAAPDAACATCHVPLAQARRLTRQDVADFPSPPSHRLLGFVEREHGRLARQDNASCATCHAREFCSQCHAGANPPRAVAALARDARSLAIRATRVPPNHGENFSERHAALASATGATCSSCHVRSDCLACHRPAPGSGRGYHTAGFLARHPAAAYARESSCSECHSVTQFCASCHQRSGLVSGGPLRAGYHDAQPFFLLGHGQAARQTLETCVGCHAERDCVACHTAGAGRRFNPHGAGFDAARLRRKNPEMCIACHGTNIPGD
jgi:hypothetical protein